MELGSGGSGRRERFFSVRGHVFVVHETRQRPTFGPVMSVFSADSAHGLVYDSVVAFTLDDLLRLIDSHLPDWIENTRKQGFPVREYDGALPIVELENDVS